MEEEKKKITVYRVGLTAPIPTTCDVFGYPHKDDDGNVMYNNSHYTDVVECWMRVLAEMDARFRYSVMAVTTARIRLSQAEEFLVQAAVDKYECAEQYKAWIDSRIGDENL